VFQPLFDTLALEVYGNAAARRILVCLRSGACRMHETFRALPKSEKPLRFAEFLKSRLVNGRIEEAVQLGDNRIVRLTVRRGENQYRLYIRLWSNAANVIVTAEDGTILDAMRRLPGRGEVSGGRYRPEDAAPGTGTVKEYAVREFGESGGTFNGKIDAFYAEHDGNLSPEALRTQALRALSGSTGRLQAALDRLEEKEAAYRNADRWKELGDMVLANAAAIEPGVSWFEAETGDGIIRIELDAAKSAVENAQALYAKYRKARKGLRDVGEELRAGRAELERLEETERRLLAESDPVVLQKLLKKIRKGEGAFDHAEGKGTAAAKAAKAASGRPGLSFMDGDWLLVVGRDGKENDELLRRHVRGNDLWLHVRDWPGSYVFIKQRSGKSVPLDVLLDAGNLALFYSKGRNNGRGDCYYTQVKYLRRVKNGPPGKVLAAQEKNLSVTLDQKRLKRLEGTRLYR
jgi:predicted ribosome quality control (RQC) complex YloA/Tae2 family protein